MAETYEQQMKDSDTIFTSISTGDFDNFEQAQRAVVTIYATDTTVSRAGISHALKRLERHYSETPGNRHEQQSEYNHGRGPTKKN